MRPLRRRVLAMLGAIPVLGGFFGITRTAGAARPVAAFDAKDPEGAIRELFGAAVIAPSDRIEIEIASYVENGAIVPIAVTVKAEAVRSITLFAADNPVPLVARFEFGGDADPILGTRIKLAQSTRVIVIAETAAGNWRNERRVEVGVGGCT